MSPEKIKELYKGYREAKRIWTNIGENNIDENSELMYNLYQTLDEYEILDSKSTTEEKKEETQNRFTDLGIFMMDSGSIRVLTELNNQEYSFVNVINNPFVLTEEKCERTYIINDEEPLIETKARTIDCENKITKMCMAQMVAIVGQNSKSKISSQEEIEKANLEKIQQYTILLDRLQGTRLSQHTELQDIKGVEEAFTGEETFFDTSKFLRKVNETNKNGKTYELENKYGEIISEIINNETPNQYRASIKGMQCNISEFGNFAIARRLMTKLYTYKEVDICDLFTEYDLIKGTQDQDNVLITYDNDNSKRQGLSKIINIMIQGYNQPFSVHVRDDLYDILNKNFGKIPINTVDSPQIYRKEKEGFRKVRSKVTLKLEKTPEALASKVLREDKSNKTYEYLEYLKELQKINKQKKKIDEAKAKMKKKTEERKKQNLKNISKVKKQITKYTRDINKTQDIKDKTMSSKESRKKRTESINQKLSQTLQQEKTLQELRRKKGELEKQLMRLLNEKEKTKDD